MKKFQVYAAGPMNGQTYEQANAWRLEAAEQLGKQGIAVRSPMRDKEFLVNKTIWSEDAEDFHSPWATHKAIMTRDSNDVLTSDVVLVNFCSCEDESISIGTVMEMTLAWQAGIPVVVCAPMDHYCDYHPMLAETVGFRCTTLEQACHVVATILGV